MKYEYGFMGFGVSNRATVEFLISKGVKNMFVSSDAFLSDSDKLFLSGNEIAFEENGNTERLLTCSSIVVSPGVFPSNRIIKDAGIMGIPILIDIDLIDGYIDRDVRKIGITGTNGKTTTVELTTAVLSNKYRAFSVGNIGVSPAKLAEEENTDFLVYELSSYQLHYIQNTKFDFGALLNVTEDHLSWHGGMKNYLEDKLRLCGFSSKFAFNTDNLSLSGNPDFLKVGIITDSRNECGIDFKSKKFVININGKESEVSFSGLKLLGDHNIYNSAFAALIGIYFGVSEKDIEKTLDEFSPEEHRMEMFAGVKNIEFVNDSKSTNADSLINAIRTFRGRHENLLLLCGGRGKGEDYTKLSEEIIKSVDKTYVCGENSEELCKYLNGRCAHEKHDNWDSLIESVFAGLKDDTTVLFSPGGSSFDFFKNYKERGEYFKNKIHSKLDTSIF